MRGHYFLKWLFLTVLSVSALHFRESNGANVNQTEQVSASQSIGAKQSLLDFKHENPAGIQPAIFVYFKNIQRIHLLHLSNALSCSAIKLPKLSLLPSPNRGSIQNQHFRSRTLTSDTDSISQS